MIILYTYLGRQADQHEGSKRKKRWLKATCTCYNHNMQVVSGCYYYAGDSGSSVFFVGHEDFSSATTMNRSSSSSTDETRSSAASRISISAVREIRLRANDGRANEKGLVRDVVSEERQVAPFVPCWLLRPGTFIIVDAAWVGSNVVQQMMIKSREEIVLLSSWLRKIDSFIYQLLGGQG